MPRTALCLAPQAKLIDTYHNVGLALETLTYQSAQKFTLYFPAGGG